MIYLQLFLSFFYVGFFTLGGGYAALPLIAEQTVTIRGWLTLTEFSDLITISEITPGPISINSATFVGTKVAGLPGALAATAGFLLPPFLIVTIFFLIYNRFSKMALVKGVFDGLRPAVVSLIAAAGLRVMILAFWGEAGISIDSFSILSALIFVLALFTLLKWKPNPIIIILCSGLFGLIGAFI